jgi:hypothetical protein
MTMIKIEQIYRDIDSLPEEAQTLLLDFIELLKKRYLQPEKENLPSIDETIKNLDPWTQSLIGVIKPSEDEETLREAYIDYLEEKYR